MGNILAKSGKLIKIDKIADIFKHGDNEYRVEYFNDNTEYCTDTTTEAEYKKVLDEKHSHSFFKMMFF